MTAEAFMTSDDLLSARGLLTWKVSCVASAAAGLFNEKGRNPETSRFLKSYSILKTRKDTLLCNKSRLTDLHKDELEPSPSFCKSVKIYALRSIATE